MAKHEGEVTLGADVTLLSERCPFFHGGFVVAALVRIISGLRELEAKYLK